MSCFSSYSFIFSICKYKLIFACFCIMLYVDQVHEIMVPLAHATSEVSDEPAHPHSLARGITAHIHSDSFTVLGLWVLRLATSNINESPLQTDESKTLFLMTSLPYYCIPGLAEIKTYAQKMQDAQVTKSLHTHRRNMSKVRLLVPLGGCV